MPRSITSRKRSWRGCAAERRLRWFNTQLDLDPERVFIDETWASTYMARRYGRCRAANACRLAFRMAIGKRRHLSAD